MIILDTNVLSELTKRSPAQQVLRWFAVQPRLQLFTTAITQAEILYGLELLPRGKRRGALQAATEAMFAEEFSGRILAFDTNAARAFPAIAAGRRSRGRPITQLDAQIAAIAWSWSASISTRNTADFEHCGIDVVDPWNDV